MADLGVGNKCNCNCIMCTAVMPPKKNDWISKEDLFSQIDDCDDNSLTITGGEPTIYPHLFELLQYINAKYPNKKIHLISNARMFSYPEFAQKFSQIKNLAVKTELLASHSELHDKISGVKGSFVQSTAGIKNILSLGFQTEFRFVLSKLNYKDAPKLASLVKINYKNLDSVVIFPIDLIGNAYINKNETQISFKELIPQVKNVIQTLKDFEVQLYHIPYCVLPSEHYKYVHHGVTVLERRVAFQEICDGCKFEKVCPRVWQTYTKNFGTDEFHKIGE